MSDKPTGIELDEAEWGWLLPHAVRGVLIMVSPELSLAHVAERLAANDVAQTQAWLERKLLAKPLQDEIDRRGKNPGAKFLFVIVAPFVLAQEIVTSGIHRA